MKIRRIKSMALKEFFHIIRDPFTLGLALGLPLIMVTIFGMAIEFNIQKIPLIITDKDHSTLSRTVIQTFLSSHFFVGTKVDNSYEQVLALDSESAKVSLSIPHGFQRDPHSEILQIAVDGADNATAGIIGGYLQKISQKLNHTPASKLHVRYLFNPELKSKWFIVPGLAVVILAIISILLTALTVAKEWENGSMELLLSTPISPSEIILGKLLPYVVLSFFALIFVYFTARIFFEIPFIGNHLTFLLASIMFLITYLALGIFISTIARNQQIAMQISIVAGLLPSLLLSGFIFPIESMPLFFHYFTSILPAKWFMIIARSMFLQGASLIELKTPLLTLLFMDFFLIFLAVKRFKRDLEN